MSGAIIGDISLHHSCHPEGIKGAHAAAAVRYFGAVWGTGHGSRSMYMRQASAWESHVVSERGIVDMNEPEEVSMAACWLKEPSCIFTDILHRVIARWIT